MSELALPSAPVRPAATGLRGRVASVLSGRLDDARLAVGAIASHKLRASLTLLGIVIGVFTVVAMASLLTGLRNAMEKNMGGLGADVFQIQKWPNFNFGPLSPEIQRRRNITLHDVVQLRDLLPQAKQVGGEVWDFGKEVSAGGNSDPGTIIAGGTPEFFSNNNLPIGSGRGFSEGEAMGGARVAVLGASAVDVLFPGQNPLGQHIRLGRLDLEVIGTVERQGGNGFGGNPDNLCAIPISLFLELYGTNRSLNVTVMANGHGEVNKLLDLAIGAFRRVRGLDANVENDFDYFTNDSTRQAFDQMAGTISAGLLLVCAFSLVVGGIGVMNIMLVTVTERTREIGMRKALGARRSRVLVQFIIEAVLLSACGGVLGVLLGVGGTWIARFLSFPAEVPAWAPVVGVAVSCGIGLAAGIYPAWRASRLDPAVALRDE